MAEHPDVNLVEMDTVHGCEGSHKVFLTFYFRCCKLMLIYLLPDRTTKSVKKVFDDLERRLTTLGFCTAFPVILTDRGMEFSDPDALEAGVNGFIRTSIYYCDPMASWQKGGLEKTMNLSGMLYLKDCPLTTLRSGMPRNWQTTSTQQHAPASTAAIRLNWQRYCLAKRP